MKGMYQNILDQMTSRIEYSIKHRTLKQSNEGNRGTTHPHLDIPLTSTWLGPGTLGLLLPMEEEGVNNG